MRISCKAAALMASCALLCACAAPDSKPGLYQDHAGILYDGVAPLEHYYIWPDKRAPGDESTVVETVTQRAGAGELSDRIYTGTQEPKLAMYYPEKPNGVGLILFPGGAYVRTVIDKEGEVLAPVFAKLGYTVAILNYRLPCDNHVEGSDAPLADAQRAVRVMRSLSEELHLTKIGVMGFSAGGSLAANLQTKFDEQVYKPCDERDALSARPDFAALIYPVISMEDGITHAQSRDSLLGENPAQETLDHYSADKLARPDSPPAFIVHASDDPDVPVTNSLLMFEALKKAGLDSEMHIFKEGGHGFGLRNVKDKPASAWPYLFDSWQQSL